MIRINFIPNFQRSKSSSYGAETAQKVEERKQQVDQIRRCLDLSTDFSPVTDFCLGCLPPPPQLRKTKTRHKCRKKVVVRKYENCKKCANKMKNKSEGVFRDYPAKGIWTDTRLLPSDGE